MIMMEHVCKSYRIAKRNAGFREACKSLFFREYEVATALSDVSFTIGDGATSAPTERGKAPQSKF